MDEDNVMKLTAPLEDGRQYFWRVDAVINKEVTYKGDVWSFMTMPASLGQNGMLQANLQPASKLSFRVSFGVRLLRDFS